MVLFDAKHHEDRTRDLAASFRQAGGRAGRLGPASVDYPEVPLHPDWPVRLNLQYAAANIR
jgi:hypothetical protein